MLVQINVFLIDCTSENPITQTAKFKTKYWVGIRVMFLGRRRGPFVCLNILRRLASLFGKKINDCFREDKAGKCIWAWERGLDYCHISNLKMYVYFPIISIMVLQLWHIYNITIWAFPDMKKQFSHPYLSKIEPRMQYSRRVYSSSFPDHPIRNYVRNTKFIKTYLIVFWIM